MAPSNATAPLPSATPCSNAAMRRCARPTSSAEGPYSSLMTGTYEGWMHEAQAKPRPRDRRSPAR